MHVLSRSVPVARRGAASFPRADFGRARIVGMGVCVVRAEQVLPRQAVMVQMMEARVGSPALRVRLHRSVVHLAAQLRVESAPSPPRQSPADSNLDQGSAPRRDGICTEQSGSRLTAGSRSHGAGETGLGTSRQRAAYCAGLGCVFIRCIGMHWTERTTRELSQSPF